MCVEKTADDRNRRKDRRKYENAKRRSNDGEKRIKAVKVVKEPLFDDDDPLAAVDLRRVKSLAELNTLE